jgi:hypothetical protein
MLPLFCFDKSLSNVIITEKRFLWDSTVLHPSYHPNLKKTIMKRFPSILLTLSGITLLNCNLPAALAQTEEVTIIEEAIALEEPGLYLISAILEYSDGDVLTADFRVYCPTGTMRPTNYVLVDKNNNLKKEGEWWEPAFKPEYVPETELMELVCGP